MEEDVRRENARWLIAAAIIHGPWASKFESLIEAHEYVRSVEQPCDGAEIAMLRETAEAYNEHGPFSEEGRQFLAAALCALKRADQLPDGIAASLLRFLVTGRFPLP